MITSTLDLPLREYDQVVMHRIRFVGRQPSLNRTPEKRQKSDSNVGEEVESPKTSPNLPTSIDSKHRKSGFDPAWLKDFSWLQTNNDVNGSNSGMMCKLCRKHNQRPQKVRQVVESKTENDSRLRKSS